MLPITIPEQKVFDEDTSTFYSVQETKLHLEHSLYAISKWESKWKIPFLDKKEKTPEQIVDYVRCMCLDEDVDPLVFKALTRKNIVSINDYLNDKYTATWITEQKGKAGSKKCNKAITSELIYYYMTALQIPFTADRWNIQRLIMLIEIASIEQQPNKKMPKSANISQRKALNASRKKRLGTRG